jgi:hypothetical protein
MRIIAGAGVLLCMLSLGGCVFYPERVDYYDAECRVTRHRLQLGVEVIGDIGDCDGQKAEACLVAIAAVGGASAVISGSIVIVGNTIYWLERQGPCRSHFT